MWIIQEICLPSSLEFAHGVNRFTYDELRMVILFYNFRQEAWARGLCDVSQDPEKMLEKTSRSAGAKSWFNRLDNCRHAIQTKDKPRSDCTLWSVGTTSPHWKLWKAFRSRVLNGGLLTR
jgi:hypothetical protein